MSQCLNFHCLEAGPKWDFWHFRPTLRALKTCLSFRIAKLYFAIQITKLSSIHAL